MLYLLSTTRVANSRFFRRQNTVWRRRQTPDGVVFTTREKLDFEQITVISKDGTQTHFKPGTLYLSLLRACDHLDNAEDIAWNIKTTVEEKLTFLLDNTLTLEAEDIARVCIRTLKLYNTSAYVKYASYYPKIVSSRKLAASIR